MQPSLDDAHFLGERFSIAPLLPRKKVPRKGYPLSERFERRLTQDEIYDIWTPTKKVRSNIAIVCGQISGVIGVDADSIENARDLYRKLPKTPAMTRTKNGVHFLFAYDGKLEIGPKVKTTVMGIEADIRGEASYLLGPGSIHPEGPVYEKVGDWNGSLPVFDPSWIEAKTRPGVAPVGAVRDALAYIQRIHAVSGERGHATTFRAACKLRDAGLSEAEALEALIIWNETNAEPPWTLRELTHKVTDAFRKGGS